MKKVILTGGSGLIGKETIKPLIEAGFEVYALTIDNKCKADCVHWLKCNIFNEQEVKKVFEKIKPQYLLHFAWIASRDYLTSDVNYKYHDATFNMLRVFTHQGGKRAVFAGTCFEYEFQDEPLKENGKLRPETLYAKCKNELRRKAEDFAKEQGISFGWGRIFYVFGHGENEKRLTPYVINSLKQGLKVTIGSGPLLRDYMYAKDIGLAFVKFLDTNVEGCVNICTGEGILIRDYVLKIASKLNRVDLVTFEDNVGGQPKIIVGDNTRLKVEVGYLPKYSTDAVLEIIQNDYQAMMTSME